MLLQNTISYVSVFYKFINEKYEVVATSKRKYDRLIIVIHKQVKENILKLIIEVNSR